MFCLRSWLPLLFIPTNASPAFIFLFFVCSYFLNRPCVYCSVLLLILFLTSCNWSDRCFFDFSSNWFLPRHTTPFLPAAAPAASTSQGLVGAEDFNATVVEMINGTVRALAGAVVEEVGMLREEWTGIGVEWLRNLIGKREWRVDCMDIYIRL